MKNYDSELKSYMAIRGDIIKFHRTETEKEYFIVLKSVSKRTAWLMSLTDFKISPYDPYYFSQDTWEFIYRIES